MPLIKPVLELQILAAFQKMSASKSDMATAQRELAKELATAIDAYIKSATIITPPGQAVVGSVTSTPAPPALIS
jgi:hypothetical protein